ncbi:MAG: NFACT family protein [Oscillospiraceae bacterium]|nr:NFACT family protein [Oscillospiraceae bacterium]
MALDGAFLLAVKQELEPLVNGRIEKIYQPSKEEIVLGMRTRTGSFKVLISANAASARIHITNQQIENPKVPPMFCMLLRKRLGSGKLISVRQDGLERILFLDFETVNELGDVVTVTLACEIMGKHSNLIVIDGNGRIIDSLKRTDDAMSRERLILPNVTYTAPPREERLNFLIADESDMSDRISACTGKSGAKCLISVFEGISPVLAREWIFRASRGNDLTSENFDRETVSRIVNEIIGTRNRFFEGNRKYTIISDNDGNLKDFCFDEINQYGSLMKTSPCTSACETLDRFYSERDRTARMKQRYQDLFKLLGNTYDRILRRTENQKMELSESEKREELKLCGDLISANMYAMSKGMKEFTCVNFYDENGGEITIPLDPMLTPSQNMQKYYSGYRKADNAQKRLKVLIEKGEEELLYIASVSDALSRAVTENDVNELRAELAEQGYIRAQKGKQKPPKPAPPLEFISPDGFTVLVGRNNKQNDILTTKTAEKTDIWLHTKDITGSHVIIRAEGREVPDETILYAARLAAAHSSAKNSAQVPVDYVTAKFVKKPSGAKPGMVIFTNNRTLYVKPLEAEINQL